MNPIVLTRQQKQDYLYMPNQRVRFQLCDRFYTGSVVGMSTSYNALPLLGTIWIIKLDASIPGYVYDCVTSPSLFMEPLEGM